MRLTRPFTAAALAVALAGCGILAPERATKLTVATAEGNVISVGGQVQLVATATMKDGQDRVVTGEAHWTSRNTAVALVSPTGLVVGLAAGSADISAEFGDAWAHMSIHVQ